MTTALRDAIDQTALGWVKPEIDETLRQARIDLEGFAGAPDDASPMNSCVAGLHQVYGSLRMLDLQAPALVAAEMEQVAVALLGGTTGSRDEALAVLMRGMVQLPDYLERLQGGHRDIPIVLLPLINELRAARGAEAMSQDALPSLVVEPTEAEIEHARGSLAGRNRALLDTVSSAIKEDLLRVKDALDLYLRGARGNVAELVPQAEALDRIGDTLSMLGLESARATVHEQCKVVNDIASGVRPSSESDLMEVAGALISIEHSLDDQVADLGNSGADRDGDDRRAQESRKVIGVLSRAATNNFAEVRGAFVAFIETNWDHGALKRVPDLLTEVAGAMRILELPESAGYLDALRVFTQRELVDRQRVPDGVQLDTLADALASMEYFLESLHDPRDTRGDLLGKARSSLEALNYWPIPEGEAEVAAESHAMAEQPKGVPVPIEGTVEAEEEAGATTAAAGEAAVDSTASAASVVAIASVGTGIDAGFITAGEEIDDEIREIFLEEFQEELGNLEELLVAWRLTPDDLELLRPIRRVFHTLKGSGRLVGAKVLGEFSWHVENMLNRVLDGSRPASYAVVAFVGQVSGVLPKLHAALRGESALDVDIPTLEAVADRIGAGEDVLLQAAPAAVEAVTEEAAEPMLQEAAVDAATVPADIETVAATVDPVLLEILGSEVGSHLETIDAWLAQARAGQAQPNDALARAIHTLNGAFAMTEVPSVTDFTAPAEGYVRRLLAAQAEPDAAGVDALGELAEAVRASTLALQDSPDRVPVYRALAERMVSLRDALPEPSVPFIDMALVEAQREAEAQAEAEVRAAEEAALLESERIAAEQAEAERVAAEQAEAERVAAEQAEAERVAAEQAEAERVAAEQTETERAAAEQAEAERVAAEQTETERAAAEQAEAERVAAEQAEAERVAAEQAEAERVAAEQAEAERVAAEQAEAER
ncbi:MAG: Hpt domain-containing protein, partial [Thermomonas sp.]|uniref:Hpt domain-containing protein n=1 Tax=Thermomonas sp. TaxID=1971895 RepID=UPI0026027C5C